MIALTIIVLAVVWWLSFVIEPYTKLEDMDGRNCHPRSMTE